MGTEEFIGIVQPDSGPGAMDCAAVWVFRISGEFDFADGAMREHEVVQHGDVVLDTDAV